MEAVEKVFKAGDGALLVIAPNIVKRILKYRQLNFRQTEAGGVLIGERRGKHIIVKEISEPGKGDRRSRFSVDRRGPHHQKIVNAAFESSAGILQYVGEWHTHPEDHPSPSYTDLSSWRQNLNESEAMILLIVGRSSMWVSQKREIELIEMNEV